MVARRRLGQRLGHGSGAGLAPTGSNDGEVSTDSLNLRGARSVLGSTTSQAGRRHASGASGGYTDFDLPRKEAACRDATQIDVGEASCP